MKNSIVVTDNMRAVRLLEGSIKALERLSTEDRLTFEIEVRKAVAMYLEVRREDLSPPLIL